MEPKIEMSVSVRVVAGGEPRVLNSPRMIVAPGRDDWADVRRNVRDFAEALVRAVERYDSLEEFMKGTEPRPDSKDTR